MKRKKILILDDDSRIRQIYYRLLQSVGNSVFEVLEADNICEASRILVKFRVDLLLLDLRMPGVNGHEFYDVLRHSSIKPDVLVVSVFPVDEQKRLIPDARDYYDKTKGPLGLLEKVSCLLS